MRTSKVVTARLRTPAPPTPRSGAREAVLGRIRRALADVPAAERPTDVPVLRDYAPGGNPPPGSERAVALFTDRLLDYGATVRTVAEPDAAEALADLLAGAERIAVPRGFPAARLRRLPAQQVVTDAPPLSVLALDALDAVVTLAAVAVAETGTLVLDGGSGQGRRALTLVPDRHVCMVGADQVVASLPEAVALLDPLRPLTFVSGPSATSDIELDRVEGVHGPRRLDVLIVEPKRRVRPAVT